MRFWLLTLGLAALGICEAAGRAAAPVALGGASSAHGVTQVYVTPQASDTAPASGHPAALRLARHFLRLHPATGLNWDWAPGVFLYGLAKAAETASPADAKWIRATLLSYHDHWMHRGLPTLNRSDACAPALSALALATAADPSGEGLASAAAVADYLRNEPRNELGSLNHLGHSALAFAYPDTIWVDSLMMIGVFGAQWGTFARDPELLDFAAAQPGIFARVLQDSATGLFRHAWRIRSARPIPESPTFWLRGNGWVMVSIVEMLDVLPADSPRRAELMAILNGVAAGLERFQEADGRWDSLANLPGETFPESSGTLLAAYAMAKGARQGWLPARYLGVARRAFAGVTAILKEVPGGLSLPFNSGNTNPGPRWLYRLVPKVADSPYGVGAYLMAASELAPSELAQSKLASSPGK